MNNLKEVSEILQVGVDVNGRGCFDQDQMQRMVDQVASLTDKEFEETDVDIIAAATLGPISLVLLAIFLEMFFPKSSYIGYTPLMIAAERDNVNAVNFFISAGANIEDKSQYGRTALMIASRYGSNGCLKVLIRAGANMETINERSGDTSLMNSLRCRSWASCDLIEAGANIETKN
mmetsp:Transcript_43743/g.56103  ORF Transcript_43743/g.56103 Transcript_43743/m.56103 type:complete len:176 (-) Transcript_43743:577-1104(-)